MNALTDAVNGLFSKADALMVPLAAGPIADKFSRRGIDRHCNLHLL